MTLDRNLRLKTYCDISVIPYLPVISKHVGLLSNLWASLSVFPLLIWYNVGPKTWHGKPHMVKTSSRFLQECRKTTFPFCSYAVMGA